MDWIYIAAYLVIQIIIGLYLSKFVSSEGDFFLAGRKLPTFALSFSIFATWFGAETCIGSSGAVFSQGLSGSKAEPIGYGMCLLLTALVLAPKIWNSKYTTLGDFFRSRYSGSTEKLAIWILLPGSLIWAAAQVRAFGQVISATSPVDVTTGITIATVFVIFYTMLGGLLGDIVTDVLQGGILAFGLVIVLIMAFDQTGGIANSISSIPKEKLTFISKEGSLLEKIDSWMIPIFGSLVAQELIARVLASKDSNQAIKASLGGTGLYLFFGSIPIFLGLIGHNFNLNLQSNEQFLPTIAKEMLPPVLYIIFAGALISAILSTIDSILLAISALISHNIIVPTFEITGSKKKLLCARITLVSCGLIAYIMALYGESVYEMVEAASAFGTTGILAITIGGLYGVRANTKVANIVLISGLIFSIIFQYVLKLPASFTLNLIIVSLLFIGLSFILKTSGPREKSI